MPVRGLDRPMQTPTYADSGLSIINFGIGSSNATTVMDLLLTIKLKGVLFLGKCSGIKHSTKIGHFILPIAAPLELVVVPPDAAVGRVDDAGAVVHLCLDDLRRDKLVQLEGRHRRHFRRQIIVGGTLAANRHASSASTWRQRRYSRSALPGTPRGTPLLVSDIPMTPQGVKTERSDRAATERYVDLHLDIGIEAMTEISVKGEPIKHFIY